MIVLFIANNKSHPRLILRMANYGDDCNFIYGKEGRIIFGISTEHENQVILTSVRLHIPNKNSIEFLANDLFKPLITASDSGVSLCWEGQEFLRRKRFLLFWIPFRVLTPDKYNIGSNVNISATAMLDMSYWTFPLSMLSLYPKTIIFTETLTWFEKSPDSKNISFKIKPGESCYIIGTLAEESIQATGKDINVGVTEIFKDETYKITKFKSDSKK